MKTTKAITFILFLIAKQLQAQTLGSLNFVLNPNTASEVTYVYPKSTDYEITDAEGNIISDLEGHSATYDGVVSIELTTKWNDEPDQLQADKGLRISIVEHQQIDSDQVKSDNKQNTYGAYSGGIEVVSKELLEEADGYGVKMSFSNGITFKLENGQAEAFQDEQPLPIDGNFKISSPEGMLYISFDTDTAESWYFFESKN
ncbi:MAG: hypothetical protein AAF741_02005 [Bacteroidota bacterium]